MICVASIPHSGSHFVVNTIGYPLRNGPHGGNAKVQNLWHVYPGESLDTIKARVEAGWHLVVPMRSPRAIAQSWANRGKPILPHPVHNCLLELVRNLIHIIAPLGPLYLPVDVPDREKYLKRLNQALREDFRTDWVPAAHHEPIGGRNATLSDAERLAVEELIDDPFFRRFGYA